MPNHGAPRIYLFRTNWMCDRRLHRNILCASLVCIMCICVYIYMCVHICVCLTVDFIFTYILAKSIKGKKWPPQYNLRTISGCAAIYSEMDTTIIRNVRIRSWVQYILWHKCGHGFAPKASRLCIWEQFSKENTILCIEKYNSVGRLIIPPFFVYIMRRMQGRFTQGWQTLLFNVFPLLNDHRIIQYFKVYILIFVIVKRKKNQKF